MNQALARAPRAALSALPDSLTREKKKSLFDQALPLSAKPDRALGANITRRA
jgi:hypothetical protein